MDRKHIRLIAVPIIGFMIGNSLTAKGGATMLFSFFFKIWNVLPAKMAVADPQLTSMGQAPVGDAMDVRQKETGEALEQKHLDAMIIAYEPLLPYQK